MKVLVTGGCGFIGSSIVRRLLREETVVFNLDKLTYAASLEALSDVSNSPFYSLIEGDICDQAMLECLFEEFAPDAVIHCAAETHVDQSIDGPSAFVNTNIVGTYQLLEAARRWWSGKPGEHRFHHISTDEVYGSLSANDPAFTEASAYAPNSPYAASKASADHLVRAWGETFGLPVVATNCSNNYGPWQFPEKLIPLMILNGVERRPLPIYGQGDQVRDWLHVDDHAEAVWQVLQRGRTGATYNVGGRCEKTNIEVVQLICDELNGRWAEFDHHALIRNVADRPGHDQRYAVDDRLVREEIGCAPKIAFEDGIRSTIDWYLAHQDWWQAIRMRRYDGERLGRAANQAGHRPKSEAQLLDRIA
ncbi:MAG: dTDP-glucose 4,6-dehydratase [Pseudomonadota bacterium]